MSNLMDTNNIEYLKLIFQELHHHKQMYVDFAENKVDDNLTLQMNQKSFNFTFLKLIIAHGNEIYLRNYLELIPDNKFPNQNNFKTLISNALHKNIDMFAILSERYIYLFQ